MFYLQIEISILIAPIVLHCFGLYLLRCAGTSKLESNTRIHLINLSLSELAVLILGMVRRILILCQLDSLVIYYVMVFEYFGATVLYLLVMTLLTLDRFFKLYLNIKYKLYWHKSRTKKIISLLWLSLIVTTSLYAIFVEHDKESLRSRCYLYFYPICEGLFLVVAVCTYHYALREMETSIFRKRNSSRKSTVSRKNFQKSYGKNAKVISRRLDMRIKRSRKGIWMIALIIITFIMFHVTTDQVFFYLTTFETKTQQWFICMSSVVYSLGLCLDIIIYIFATPCIRKIMIKKLGCRCGGKQRKYSTKNTLPTQVQNEKHIMANTVIANRNQVT